MNKKCRLSVVSVSDFEPNQSKLWKDERALIKALANQDIQESFEVILVESKQNLDQIVPTDFYHFIPDLKVHYYDSIKSAALKDYGVILSSGEYVAVLESDCVPSRNWLRLLLEAVVNNEWVIASGRTFYGDETTYRRIMNLLHRNWYDHGKSCETNYISNNGAVYSREILEKFPYPDSVTPFLSAQIRNKQIQREGYRFYFERSVTMSISFHSCRNCCSQNCIETYKVAYGVAKNICAGMTGHYSWLLCSLNFSPFLQGSLMQSIKSKVSQAAHTGSLFTKFL